MARTKIFSVVMAFGAICSLAQGVMADEPPDLFLEHLLPFQWTGGGADDYWATPANWTPPTFPEGYPYSDPEVIPYSQPDYPDEAGRVENPDDVGEGGAVRTITPVIGADLSGAWGSDLTVDLNGGTYTVASLKMGGTGTAITTNVTDLIGTGRLAFENGELNDGETHAGDPNADPPTETEWIYGFNQGNALIWSTGTAGTGKENQITADIQCNDDVDVEGDRDLHIYGDIYEGVVDLNPTSPVPATSRIPSSSLNNLMSGGATLYLHGDIHVTDDEETSPDSTERTFNLNYTIGNPVPEDFQNPPPQITRQATLDITGQFIGDGHIQIGNDRDRHPQPISTVILHANNTQFSGKILVNRVNLVLDNDGAMGTVESGGHFGQANPNQGFGFNIISTSDTRNIPVDVEIAQWQTIKGASAVPGIESYGDHSIKFSGSVEQSNSRGWVNLLPAPKTLTIAGPQYPLEGEDDPTTDRIYTIDGSGKTLVTGGIHNMPLDPEPVDPTRKGHFRVRGTGTVVINYDETNTADSACNYYGWTWVEGSNLHFHNDQVGAEQVDLPSGTEFISTGGAVGVDSGVVGNTSFLGKFNNSANPKGVPSTGTFVYYDSNRQTVLSMYDNGGLMLAQNEYNQNLNFDTGNFAPAANMTLAAWEDNSDYTGTITPSTSIPVHPNTYMLGGGSGTLRLPNVQLVNNGGTPRNLLVTNGGEVRLEGANTYTGVTQVNRKYLGSVQEQAAANARNVNGGYPDNEMIVLTLTTLTNGGTASSMGASGSAATNLVIQGSTLKYVGAATSTDRLFTVGTNGATIDASGTGALNFTSTADLGIDIAEDRKGVMKQDSVAGDANNEVFGLPTVTTYGDITFSTEDLVPGMAITDLESTRVLVDDDSPLRITNVASAHVVIVGETDVSADEEEDNAAPYVWPGNITTTTPPHTGVPVAIHTIAFGPAPARMLTLTGSNTGDNTLSPKVKDASDRDEEWTVGMGDFQTTMVLGSPGGDGSVGIRKTGAGKWILTNNNVYTGETQVQEGTLIINGDQSAATGLTSVAAGATLGGHGTLGGDLISDGIVAPGTSAGTLTVSGTYAQNEGATLAVQLGGTTAGAYDVLQVLGTAEAGPPEGDYNDNGVVDAADYTVWRDHLGDTGDPGTLLGDGTGADLLGTPDGVVDENDYLYWKAHFGETGSGGSAAELAGELAIELISSFTPSVGNTFTVLTASSIANNGLVLSGQSAGFNLSVGATSVVLTYVGGGGSLAVGAVPEPSTLCLAVLAFLAVACGCRRR